MSCNNIVINGSECSQGITGKPLGGLITDSSIEVPNDWASYNIVNLPTSTDSILVNDIPIPPGIAVSNGISQSFPGSSFLVVSPNSTTSALVIYHLAVTASCC